MSYRLTPHTADIGAEIEAETLEGLFADAATALADLLVESGEIRPVESRSVRVAAEGLPELLVEWLSELIFRLDTEGLVFRTFEFARLEAEGLEATVRGEPLDPDRHAPGREVKAVTWHDLQVERTGGGWKARLLFDL